MVVDPFLVGRFWVEQQQDFPLQQRLWIKVRGKILFHQEELDSIGSWPLKKAWVGYFRFLGGGIFIIASWARRLLGGLGLLKGLIWGKLFLKGGPTCVSQLF